MSSKYSYKDFINGKSSAPSEQKHKVLIVDDFPENLIFVGDYLQQHDIKVMFAVNGTDALKSITNNTPDLILLDVSMPNMDGYELCKKLKSNPLTQQIPVIFLTAKVETEDILKGFESGGADYITKPFNLLELMSRVKAHLSLKDKHDKLQLMNSKLIETVKKRTEKLQEANERLSKLDRAKNEFLIHINHQLRTPLNGILGYSELLSRSRLMPDQAEFVAQINKLVQRLVKLSEKSLLFTELRADTYKFNIKLVNVIHILQNSINAISTRFEEKNIKLENKTREMELNVVADENLLFRCFNIVLENAFSYSPAGSQVFIEADKSENEYIVKIIDKGPGISNDYKEHLFEMFVPNDNNDVNNGFGLGLATAKLIMDMLSAKIDINSPLDNTGGTEAVFTFYHWAPRLQE